MTNKNCFAVVSGIKFLLINSESVLEGAIFCFENAMQMRNTSVGIIARPRDSSVLFGLKF